MVLQQGRNHLFWEKAEPGTEITISNGERSVKTKTSVPALESPGPHEIRIAGDGTQIVAPSQPSPPPFNLHPDNTGRHTLAALAAV